LSEESRKLLIVEDDPGLLSQLKWCFEGYDVVTAEDRSGAITELRRHEPMVVLQDLGLPPNPEGVDEGLATLQELLKLAPHTKVIVVTGHGDQDTIFIKSRSIPTRCNCWLSALSICLNSKTKFVDCKVL